MREICVVTDSHSGISQEEASRLGIFVVPMPFYFGEQCFYEGVSITREQFFERLAAGEDVSTSQPSPTDVTSVWDEALETAKYVVYIPISSGLSGSCETAMSLACGKKYKGKVFVVDNGRVSALLHRSVLDALELVEKGYGPEKIKKILEDSRANMNIYIAVDSLEHLKRGGRISSTAATLGTLLNIKPVLKFDIGTLDVYAKTRGFIKAKKIMLEALKNDLETKFREYYEKGEVYILAAGSTVKEVAEEWVAEIKAFFPGMDVLYDDLTMGLCCHIGQGGLGIGCSCKPPITE